MYEVEVRTLVKDFDSFKGKLDSSFEPVKLNQREVTIFFFNPNKDNFDLRLKLRKNRKFLSFKETLPDSAKKEIESDITNPEGIYNLLLKSGFEIKMIIPRVKYTYKHGKFEILLNKIVHDLPVLPLIEVETTVEDKRDADKAENEIRDFMENELGLKNLLNDGKLKKINDSYMKQMEFDSFSIESLLDFVHEKNDDIKF